MKHKLIITADDYGMSQAVNQAIEKGIAFGVLTSTNVMTNMPYCNSAKMLRDKFPNLSIGVHFCITCGKPVSKVEDIPSLVQDNGEFYSYPVFRKRYRKGLISDEDILKEISNQYEKFNELCGKADYWNTHENSHVDFKIYQLFVEFAEKNQINAMRSHQRLYVKAKDGKPKLPLLWRLIEPYKHRLITSWQKKAHNKGIASPQGVLVEMDPKDHFDCEYLFANIQWKNKEIAEYVVHPSIEADSEYMGAMVESRMVEYAIVTSSKTIDAVANNQIELVNYSQAIK